MNKKIFLILLLTFVFSLYRLQGQELKFDPKGNPEKWNVELTPFLILPWVSGEIQSKTLSQDFGIDPTDFVSSLNSTFMMDIAVSKGKFFGSAGYIYNYNEIEKILWASQNGNQTITAQPKYQRHILQVIGGIRFRSGKFILDPYAGFRYTHYRLFGEVEGIANMYELDENEDFWDPVIGIHAHYYPHPRVPIELRTDVGGFGVGSKLTSSAWFNTGYTVSPVVDLLIGFAALSNKYESETAIGNPFGFTSITYGIDIGARFNIPSRVKDPSIFKKDKQ